MWQHIINYSDKKIKSDKDSQRIQYALKVWHDVSSAIDLVIHGHKIPSNATDEMECAKRLLDEVINGDNHVLKNIATALKHPLEVLENSLPKT